MSTEKSEGPKLPEPGTKPCSCRGGDVLANPDPHCGSCGGDELRRF